MKENEILAKMLDWIYANTDAKNQAEISRRSGVNEVTISRALNGRVKHVKKETLRKINAGFGNIFNPVWLRGDSDVMLAAGEVEKPTSVSTDMHTVPEPSAPVLPTSVHADGVTSTDLNGLFNSVITAKDEAIMALKRELSGKDATITLLREQLAERSTLMQSIQKQSTDLANKYETLLHEYSKLLHRINVKIETINGSSLSIATEPPATSYEKNGQ